MFFSDAILSNTLSNNGLILFSQLDNRNLCGFINGKLFLQKHTKHHPAQFFD